MNPIINKLPKLNKYQEYISDVKKCDFPIVLSGLTDAQKVHMAYSTYFYTNMPICVVANNEIVAQNYIKDFKNIGLEEVIFLPKREVVSYDYEMESRENSMERAIVLSKLLEGQVKILVTTIESVSQPVIKKQTFKQSIISIKTEDIIDLNNFSLLLIQSGYEKTSMVEVKGQFCVRGGIIDIFPCNLELPIRIELWGDEVDNIRTFDALNQRSISTVDSVVIYPANEYIINLDNVGQIVKNIQKSVNKNISQKEREKVEQDIEEIENGIYSNKIDKYFSCFFDKENILEYLPTDMLLFFDEPERIEQRLESISFGMKELEKDLIEKQKYIPQFINNIYDVNDVNNIVRNRSLIYLKRLESMMLNTNMPAKRKEYSFSCREVNFFRNSMDIFVKEVQGAYSKGYSVVILVSNKIKGINISTVLSENNIANKFVESFDSIEELQLSTVYISIGYSSNGFEYKDLKLLVVSDNEEGESKQRIYKTSEFKNAKKIVLADLSPNDYVVHFKYGIGQFIEINTLSVNNIKRDYVRIKYKDNDILYVPTDQLDSIRKYVVINDGIPKINKLGSKDWAKAKAKAKENAESIAKELVELYAQRQKLKGFAFLPDTEWQKQFEEDFPYQETDDQLRCIKEVKEDMENDIPMDRLLCGDVGYGKTEVALRAAFKAIMSGKQVAYLVPTTVLAVQQYETFKQRMDKYGIKVAVLNRFKTKKEQIQIISKLKLGEIDAIIGTHRMLQKDVAFKNLGLLIIDEEHRFGVKHKETIKQLKHNIDVLSMTATPIPRTLHMSIVGIRDMSVIYDPPHIRKPIQTYVLEYDKYVIRDAIIKELERKGQVLYIYNRVDNIDEKAIEVQQLIPEARIDYAHGQMNGDELERIMYDYSNGEIDVLVCTTILESGIDIPNVNTLVIENADRMGLAQLYQIRGRVGRKDRQAYSYITYKRNKVISENAEKRLKAIKEFTEFGSGFKIALRDLEIRGAGNILGSEQHGHMEAVGYEMYCKLIDDAVKTLQGKKVEEELSEVQIDISVSSYISDEYIFEQSQKLEIYQSIALCQTFEDIENVKESIEDRYGQIPKEVYNLLQITRIKIIARKLGITSIIQKNNILKIEISNDNSIQNDNLMKLIDKYRLQISINNNVITMKLRQEQISQILDNIQEILGVLQ